MERKETIRLKEIQTTEAHDYFCKKIYSHTIPLFYELDDEAGGSGTLAVYGSLCGILTVPHVAAFLKDWNHVWIPYHLRAGTADIWTKCPLPFRRILSIDDLSAFLDPDMLWDEGRLDIAFIQVEKPVFYYLCECSGKSPIDLGTFSQRFKNAPQKYCDPARAHDWSWPICGFPREGIISSLELSSTVYRYDGVYTGGGITIIKPFSLTKVKGDFQGADADLVVSEIGPTEDALPRDFSGASGGGLWQVSLSEKEGVISVEEVFLGGVFVGAAKEEKRLYSRGCLSLYEIFCAYLDTVIAAEPTASLF